MILRSPNNTVQMDDWLNFIEADKFKPIYGLPIIKPQIKHKPEYVIEQYKRPKGG